MERVSVLTEHVGLGERAENCNLVAEDLGWWPGNTSCCCVDAVDD